MMTNQTKIYNRIGFLRTERGLSREDLAAALNVGYQELGYIERGDVIPDLDLALRISENLGVAVNDVFSRKPFVVRGGEGSQRL